MEQLGQPLDLGLRRLGAGLRVVCRVVYRVI